ncbi:CLUMA_CG000277, isoform A [Clunio marinus]|uniref:CLUMA_CG000277, isoform A n=1 Tax=Clunio marinus TaxID=568069 RepID=A0A1J1HGR0_9DIPT|nr:CLUMA_CG000277, isoform A [Clunio marinus]
MEIWLHWLKVMESEEFLNFTTKKYRYIRYLLMSHQEGFGREEWGQCKVMGHAEITKVGQELQYCSDMTKEYSKDSSRVYYRQYGKYFLPEILGSRPDKHIHDEMYPLIPHSP